MGKVVSFKGKDPKKQDRETLLEQLKAVRCEIEQLNEREPEDMESEAYEVWGDKHEELEDLADEILDRLDQLGGPHG